VSIRWRLFFSYLAVIVALVVALSIGVRMVGIRAVNGHMAGMTTGMMGTMARDLQNAVTAGLNEAVLWGALAAIVVALVASYVISWWITRPLELLAQAADGVASGDYGRRVGYAARDEIGKFAASFNDMAGQLEKTEEVRRELLGTISHEIRTPLANIEGYMQGLVDGVVPAEEATFDMVRREAARLSRLVTDVERLSKLEAGAVRIEPRSLAVKETVEAVLAPLRPQFELLDLSLSVDCFDQTPRMLADADKLAQVLGNILANSLRYTPSGGHVVLTVRRDDPMIVFTVRDDGIGIPPADLPHIFERFYRVDKSRSSEGGGSGIGLAVVKNLVEQMGGLISAESLPGQYTRITFTLPQAN
jgi:signal transduction histidine kinase